MTSPAPQKRRPHRGKPGPQLVDASTVRPWERQPKETDPAFAAFATYRDLPITDRTQRAVCAALHKSEALISTWSRRWNWRERARAWDNEQVRDWQETLATQRKSAAERHIRISLGFQDAVLRRLQKLTDEEIQAMRPADVARWLEVATKIEREALGESQRIDVTTAGQPVTADPLADMSPEERIGRLRELRGRIDRALEEHG